MTTFAPTSAAETLSAVQWAVSEEAPLEIVGHGSKREIGRPPQTEHALDLSKLSGVTLYEPAKLVLSAKAGTPLAEIEKLLAENGQQLAFEPMDYGPMLGVASEAGSIGGAIAANLSGPRRIKAGAARDHFLGVQAVSGRGETFKSGGRVVKNVAAAMPFTNPSRRRSPRTAKKPALRRLTRPKSRRMLIGMMPPFRIRVHMPS